jgi:hypothetical protein
MTRVGYVKALAALLAAVALGAGTSACCKTAKGPSPTPSPDAKLPQIEIQGDGEMDSDKYGNEPDDDERELFGHPASAADARAIAALVKRYYAVAAQEDGATACRLLYRALAEAEPSDFTNAPVPPGLHQAACAKVMVRLFKAGHAQVRAEDARLYVTAVRVSHNTGVAEFGPAAGRPEHSIMVHRERGVWKMDMLLASKRASLKAE